MNKIDYDCCNYCRCLNTDECPCHPSDDIKDEFVCDFHIPNYEKVIADAKADAYEDGYDKGYQQGRADKYQEIVSKYMLLTEKQVADIRAEAEREFQNSDYWNDYLAKVIADAKIEAYDECIETIKQCYVCEIIMKLEQLKKGNEE